MGILKQWCCQASVLSFGTSSPHFIHLSPNFLCVSDKFIIFVPLKTTKKLNVMKKGLKYTLVSLGSLVVLAGIGLGIMYVMSPYKVKRWLGIVSSYSDVFVDRLKGQPYTRGGYDGIDVSKHNGVIKWKEIAKNKRIKFVYIRATHGKGYVDRHYRRNIRLARKYGLKVGSYHLHPGKMEGTTAAG